MSNIAIVTDSTAYLEKETLEEYGITVIPLSVVFGQETIQETELTPEQFYEKMREHQELPSTSQPSPGEFIELYEELEKTHESVISFHLSSGISGTHQTALSASRSVENTYVYPFDSEISCAAQGFYAVEAAKLARKGKSVDEIFEQLTGIRETLSAYFIVDDLNHLYRGGRMSGAQKFLGSALQIKPILYFKDKVIVPFEKVRTHKRALRRVVELLEQDALDGSSIRATVIHANIPDQAEEIRDTLAEKFKNVDIDIGVFGPVIGTHLGEKALGITWYKQ
ncbi:DegV family protein with EDD domain [Geomicrobium halophilum]|uniref:DegV family protein with EDD domain n=1 Tax=Geomicrobium halophilum TaxID=549000 RepID=A0A841PNG1_9BACL|nr:DegV family protein [Geomicrobium halophilum]MBB6450377.1 DegV family protein with EDD domain [Geomicrobium halophilum]